MSKKGTIIQYQKDKHLTITTIITIYIPICFKTFLFGILGIFWKLTKITQRRTTSWYFLGKNTHERTAKSSIQTASRPWSLTTAWWSSWSHPAWGIVFGTARFLLVFRIPLVFSVFFLEKKNREGFRGDWTLACLYDFFHQLKTFWRILCAILLWTRLSW